MSQIDKSDWGEGPWQDEPDGAFWLAESGLPCLVARNGLGALCGYVGVYRGHPWFEEKYEEIDADAHGGLTCSAVWKDKTLADLSRLAGRFVPRGFWWVGFDCAHSGDLVPGIAQIGTLGLSSFGNGDTYRDLAYVKAEVEQLAVQAVQAGGVTLLLLSEHHFDEEE